MLLSANGVIDWLLSIKLFLIGKSEKFPASCCTQETELVNIDLSRVPSRILRCYYNF